MDKKSQHVGNHGGRYTDIDGQTKQFTVIDHDKRTTISSHMSEKIDFVKFFKDYRKELQQRILDIPASLCPLVFHDFTLRGESEVVVNWNKNMINDQGIDIGRLRDLAVILENRADQIGLTSKVIKT